MPCSLRTSTKPGFDKGGSLIWSLLNAPVIVWEFEWKEHVHAISEK